MNILALESSRSNSGDLSSRLRKARATPLQTISAIEDDSVIARLVQHVVRVRIEIENLKSFFSSDLGTN